MSFPRCLEGGSAWLGQAPPNYLQLPSSYMPVAARWFVAEVLMMVARGILAGLGKVLVAGMTTSEASEAKMQCTAIGPRQSHGHLVVCD